LLFRPRIQGRKNLPFNGSTIVFANHISVFDPIILGCLLPRKIYFMAKQELFRCRFFGALLKNLGAIPVKRGSADITAIKTALRILREGKVFGIFPEGTRNKSGSMLRFTHGAAAIAHKSKAAVVPVKIIGNYRIFQPIQIIIGKPLDLQQFYNQKSTSEILDQMSVKMSDAVKVLK